MYTKIVALEEREKKFFYDLLIFFYNDNRI